jgi:SAM-dependent methyltransferase
MFTESQEIYDAIYSWKDYAGEAERLRALIAEYKRSPGIALLDVACGTGGHIPYLQDDFAVEGLDLDPGMLAIARARHLGVPFYLGDMVDFDLGWQFDVVVCLFGSIAYVQTVPRLRQAVAAMARHVAPGGVLFVEPFFTPDVWIPGRPNATFVDQPDLKIARMNVSAVRDNIALLDFHYLVATPQGIEQFTERHELGLFTEAEYGDVFTACGLQVVYDAKGLDGRGLYIGKYPPA